MKKPLVWMALLAGAAAAAAADTRHVQGSWVNVRGAAAPDAPVLARIAANTQVQLLREEGRYCEIGFGAAQRGYVACNLLGTAPLRIEDIGEPNLPSGQPNPAYAPLRAFWVAPSLRRLLAAGEHVWMAALSEEQRRAERPGEGAGQPDKPAPRLLRPPVPEFDAMKALMQGGVVAHAENAGPRIPWPVLRQGGGELALLSDQARVWFDSEEQALLAALELPPARTSLFKDHAAIGAPDAPVDAASARFAVPERLRVLRGPKWGVTQAREFIARFDGSYDIGSLEVALDRPVFEQTLGRQGLLGAAATRLKTVFTPNGDEPACTEGYGWKPRGEAPVAGRPRVKDVLLLFHTPAPLAATQARVQSRPLKPPAAPQANGRPLSKLVLHQIDLDADGADDLLLLEGTGTGLISEQPGVLFKLAFVNVKGAWFVLALDRLAECT